MDNQTVSEFEEAINKATRDDLPLEELKDHYAERLAKLIDDKWKRGEDVVESEDVDTDDDEDVAGDGSLLEAIRRSLHAKGEVASKNGNGHSRHRGHGRNHGQVRRSSQKNEKDDLARVSKDELYDRAKRLDIPGRSQMSKDELIEAIRNSKG